MHIYTIKQELLHALIKLLHALIKAALTSLNSPELLVSSNSNLLIFLHAFWSAHLLLLYQGENSFKGRTLPLKREIALVLSNARLVFAYLCISFLCLKNMVSTALSWEALTSYWIPLPTWYSHLWIVFPFINGSGHGYWPPVWAERSVVYCLNNTFIWDWTIFLEVNCWQLGRITAKLRDTFLLTFLAQQNTNHDDKSNSFLTCMVNFSSDDNKMKRL